MQYLVGTDSVHTTAAICDYLEERATADDAVTVVAVAETDDPTSRRDCQEALNVAPVRLATVGEVETELREGDPADALLEVATELEVDEVIVGRSATTSSSECEDSSVETLFTETTRPVVVVPLPDLAP